MGIFSFFSRESEDEDEEDELLEETSEYIPRKSVSDGQTYKGMHLEVFTKDGEPLLTGQIAEHNASTMTLFRLPGELSFKIAPIGTDVSLAGYDKRLVPLHFSGTVEQSTRTVFKVKSLKQEIHPENRDNFRLPFTAPVSLYRPDDERLRNPEECTLVNISTGGCCVQSEYIHVEDEVLRVRVKLEDYAPLNFLGQVVRGVEHSPGQFRYGILFAQLTEQEITALNKTLYNLQMGIKQTHVRGEEGHW